MHFSNALESHEIRDRKIEWNYSKFLYFIRILDLSITKTIPKTIPNYQLVCTLKNLLLSFSNLNSNNFQIFQVMCCMIFFCTFILETKLANKNNNTNND